MSRPDLLTAFFLLLAGPTWAQASELNLYIDADYSVAHRAAEAIELGVRTALAENGGRIGGLPVVIVPMDHRGNVKRSLRTMENFLNDDRALAVFGGMHSPPYLSHRDFINENGILTLLPWSAAGPITRAEDGRDNWIFRLSVDDYKAGEFLIRHAVDVVGCKSVSLILLETGWGRANHVTLTQALTDRGMTPATTRFFDATIGRASARTIAQEIGSSGAECVVMLADADNGALVASALHELGGGIRLFSHWGILGGGFMSAVPHPMRTALDLHVLQTCGLDRERQGNAVLRSALDAAGFAGRDLASLRAAAGFVHAYDLTRVLIAAGEQAGPDQEWSSDIVGKRRSLHRALENLEQPVEGILSRYHPPFRPWSPAEPDAHEALGGNDLCMATIGEDGSLRAVN